MKSLSRDRVQKFFDLAKIIFKSNVRAYNSLPNVAEFSLMGLAAKPTLRTLCAGLKRSNKAPDPLYINFTKSEMFVKSLSSYFFAHNEKQCNHLLLACLSTTQANYDRASGVRTSRQKTTAFFAVVVCRCVAVLTVRFCAETSHLCSAPPLGCGTSRRFERLVWASLHLTERSHTIEVHLATLSAQTCTKSLTQSYMVLSIESIFVQQIKFGICGKDPLKTAVY